MAVEPVVFLIAGEASGDQLGASLMNNLKKQGPMTFVGIGGESMKREGLSSLFPMEELSHIGFLSIAKNLPHLLRRLRFTIQTIVRMKPDMVITIDAPDFSFRVMKRLHSLRDRPKLIHYVAPTVWAWRPGRAKKISKFLDHLLCLYPFEPPYFEKYGLESTFVGHPITNMVFQKRERDPHLLCVLPGSRASEIERLMPIYKETISRLQKNIPDLKVVLPTVEKHEQTLLNMTQDWSVPVDILVGEESRNRAFETAYVALAASGTVTLQLAAARLPFIVAYKVGKVTETIVRRMIKTPWVCMVNILKGYQENRSLKTHKPGTPWIPEYIQDDCRPDLMAKALLDLFNDNSQRAAQIKVMEDALSLLKAPEDKAAEAVISSHAS